ncbi:hypothetical protein [Catenulispora rubra]|uniref:hypothetical protein n=1 Tax=Catenulispora rubra TaxID=280293 RepID=UPI0018921C95|nr:hypothetical protein [Catenulispora rubra]
MINTSTSAGMRNTRARAPGEQASLGSYPAYVQAQSAIVPGRFEVLVSADHAAHARAVLAGSPR